MLTAEDRVRRAGHHLDDLDTKVDEFLDQKPKPYDSVAEPKADGTGYLYRAIVRKQPDPQWGLIVGDFAHNLRSALDNLLWDVVPPSLRRNNLTFPFCRDPTEFRTKTLPVLAVCTQDVIDAIERSQPYNRKNLNVRDDRLIVLNSMWNQDKHRMSTAVSHVPTHHIIVGMVFPGLFNFRPRLVQAFDDGDVIGVSDYTGPEENLHSEFAFDIAFQYWRPKRTIARITLHKMYEIVAHEVFPAFGRKI